jgi:hypothetical protein
VRDAHTYTRVVVETDSVSIMSWYGGVFGKVTIDKDTFTTLDLTLEYFWPVFNSYNKKPIANQIMHEMLTQVATIMVRSIRLKYPKSLEHAFGDDKFLKAFFHAYSEVSNFCFATEIIKRTMLKFPAVKNVDLDLFSMYYNGINMLDALYERISCM